MQDELDELCEEYLEDRFDVKIDFAIEDSLPRLLRDGLVEPGADAEDPRIKAVPLEVAHERLLAKWKTCARLSSISHCLQLLQTCCTSQCTCRHRTRLALYVNNWGADHVTVRG